MSERLTHLDEKGRARMVDVADKPVTRRTCVARGEVRMDSATLARIAEGSMPKGDVLAIYSPNLPEYAVAFHAVASIGGIVTTANPMFTGTITGIQNGDNITANYTSAATPTTIAESATLNAGQ